MTVLLVDDVEDIRTLLRAALVSQSKVEVVLEASDGHAALQQWRTHRPDVIILDDRMPGMSGLDVAAIILSEEPNQNIILFSAFIEEKTMQRAQEMGVIACLGKDRYLDVAELAQSLNRTR